MGLDLTRKAELRLLAPRLRFGFPLSKLNLPFSNRLAVISIALLVIQQLFMAERNGSQNAGQRGCE